MDLFLGNARGVGIDREWTRLVEVDKLATVIVGALKSKREAIKLLERLLLMLANSAAVRDQSADPILDRLSDIDKADYLDDLRYQLGDEAKEFDIQGHIYKIREIIERFPYLPSKRAPEWSIVHSRDGLSTFRIGNYVREIETTRMKMLIEMASEPEVVLMLTRYACIISGSQHWSAPPSYFRILYNMGVRIESFSSPINAQFLLPEYRNNMTAIGLRGGKVSICTLFPDVDKPFGSIGGFFQVDFVDLYTADFTPQVVVGPPYLDSLILKIAHRVISQCNKAHESRKKVRFVLTHSNSWDLHSEGFALLRTSPWKTVDHVYHAGKHSYVDDRGKVIPARFDTRLFVLEVGMKITFAEELALKNDLFL